MLISAAQCLQHTAPRIGKHRAAARCWSVRKLLPGRANQRPNWSISDWNYWQKEHTAGVTNYAIIPTGRSILLQQRKPRYLTESRPSHDLRVVINLHVRDVGYFIEGQLTK